MDRSFVRLAAELCRGGSIASAREAGAGRGRADVVYDWRTQQQPSEPRDEHATIDFELDDGRGGCVRGLDDGVGLVRAGVGLFGARPCQERCPGKQDPRIGRQDQRDDAVPGYDSSVDQAQPAGCQRYGSGHRRQAHSDQCPRRALRQPAFCRELPIERQAARTGSRRSALESTWP